MGKKKGVGILEEVREKRFLSFGCGREAREKKRRREVDAAKVEIR